ncbi:MAG: N-acyl homoserine lactonase family protein [Planctomycetes bacterium]|nr:N-acyl homoserine lactonase family protein [Planctomycetota bacterium]
MSNDSIRVPSSALGGLFTSPRVALHALAVTVAALAASCASSPERSVCRLTPLHVGICHLGADHVLGGDHTAEERIPFALYSFLVEGPAGETALVDLGPVTLEYTNRMFRRYKFFRDLGPDAPGGIRYPDDIVQPYGNVFRHLEERGIAPEDIDHVVLTHLHADHHGMDDATDGGGAEAFVSATFHASRIGWDDNVKKRRGGQWASYVDFAFSDFLAAADAEGRARFDDDVEIFPGLRTMYLGGHSICSQAVVVETAEGPAIIASDDIYLYRLLEEDIPAAIHTTPANLRAAVRRIVDLAEAQGGVIIPCHDPIVARVHRSDPDAWIAALRRVSDRAIEGYRRAAQTR